VIRSLSMYPKSADPDQVDDIVNRTTAHFKSSPGFVSATTSVDALMGPGAKEGDFGRAVMVDFETLEDALRALQSDDFREFTVASEKLSATHLLFEVREL
jgi:uncharacterized protein (DUF1330 family)